MALMADNTIKVKRNPGKIRRWMYEVDGSLFGPLYQTKKDAEAHIVLGKGVKAVRVEITKVR